MTRRIITTTTMNSDNERKDNDNEGEAHNKDDVEEEEADNDNIIIKTVSKKTQQGRQITWLSILSYHISCKQKVTFLYLA